MGKLGDVVTEIEFEPEMVFFTKEVEKYQNLLAKNELSLSKIVADCKLMLE